ncbi:MAG: BMP family ABC transporter substrate-binding protein [Myxococcales bacterium]|nr:BMP family ABC transporter substrate-binding protein [Myxococcales bacterium]
MAIEYTSPQGLCGKTPDVQARLDSHTANEGSPRRDKTRSAAGWSAGQRSLRWRLLGVTLGLVLLNGLLLLPTGSSTGRSTAAVSRDRLRVGLVFDVGGRGDKSFNDAAYRGVERAQRELDIEAEFIEPGEGTDRESGLRLLAARGFDLIIGVGFVFSDDMLMVAKDYPQRRFANVDYAKFDEHGFVMPPKNMVALKFREEEGSYLVGAIAGLSTASHVVGFVGGMDIPLIHKFENGYRLGVRSVCPDCRVLVGYAGTSGDAFKNPTRGKELAMAQYAAKAEVIFHAAGSTGLGVFEAAREHKQKAIGVDCDQWDEAPGVILTSMIKRVDVSVFEVIADLKRGRFESGVRVFGLAEGGVDYVYAEPERGMIAPAVRARVESLRQQIVAGAIHVDGERAPASPPKAEPRDAPPGEARKGGAP